MKIRPYVDEDRNEVLSLHHELHSFEWPLRSLRSRSPSLSKEYFEKEYDDIMADEDCDWMFIVAEDHGSLIGYVFCLADKELLDDPREQVHVLDIMVTEDARGEGVGRTLMNAVEEFASDRGITRITLDVLSANERAVGFYKKLGFETAVFTMQMIMPT
ncbi:MAG: GNAT family N-acetyltransferase [Pseudomonadota bacterium]